MNNKHVALLLIAMCVLGTFGLWQRLNKNLLDAKTAKEDAEFAHTSAITNFNLRKMQVDTIKQDTTAVRGFLNAWMSKLKETDDESKARIAFDRVLKQGTQGLIVKSNKSKMEEIKDASFITRRYQSVVAMEGDYIAALSMLANIEKQLPASRVAAYSIAKGTRGDDVKFSFTLETPVMAPTVEPAAAK